MSTDKSLYFRAKSAHPKINLKCGAALVGLALGLAATPAAAESNEEAANEDDRNVIIVTAQRREQNLQDVPISVTAIGAEDITRRDINSVAVLTDQVPSLIVGLNSERTNVTIRGIGSGISNIAAEASVPINIDGVYRTRVALSGATFADVEQIEVLRGPQGTLYGRNATGGTINITTRAPDGTFNGNVSALVANGGRYRMRGAIGLPITDTISARGSIELETIDGYRFNVTRDELADPEEHIAGRLAVRWEPSSDVEVTLRANISQDNIAPIVHYGTYVGGPFSPVIAPYNGQTSIDPRNVRHNDPTEFIFRDETYSGTIVWDVGNVTIKSITAYQRHRLDSSQDSDGTDVLYSLTEFTENSPAFTQEVTFSGSSDLLDWVVGGWYMDEDASAELDFVFNPLFPFPNFTLFYDQETEALAAFGQATVNVTDALRVTAGLRYSDETKTLTQTRIPQCNGLVTVNKYDDLSPKFGVDFDASDNVLIYASATKGFKAGGGNVAACGNVYGPETLWAYEAGLKTQWFDDRLTLNVNAFIYDYAGFQANQIVPPGSAVTTNASSADVLGFELEANAEPVDGLTFSVSAAYNDSEFGEFLSAPQFGGPPTQLEGNRLPLSPEFSGNASVQYELPVGAEGTLILRGEHRWTSSYFFDQFNVPFTRQEGFGMSNAMITYDVGNGLVINAYVRNIQDKDIISRADGSGFFGGTRLGYERPRTYGTEVSYSF